MLLYPFYHFAPTNLPAKDKLKMNLKMDVFETYPD